VHRQTITDPAKVREIEAALRNKQAASALAEVVKGEHPELGFVVLVKTSEGTVLLKDGERLRQPGPALREAA
jgi:predicted RNase H-like nuclease